MKLTKLQLETAKFATIDGNRDVDTKRLKKVIKKDGRVFVPILTIRYQDIQNKDIVLYDLRTGQRIEKPSSDYYIVLDGQHRSKCALELYDEMQEEGSDVKIKYFIYANIFEIEDITDANIPYDIMVLIMSINSSAKSWGSKDYIKSAYTHMPDDKVLIVVRLLTTLGFSISNISRLLYNNHKTLNSQVLSRYISGEENLPEGISLMKVLEILRMLIDKGFGISFLKKRYLAEEIVRKRNSEQLDKFLNSLCRLDSDTVKRIMELSPQELDSHKIRYIVREFEKGLCEEEQAKCFIPDMTEKRLYENIEYLQDIAEEIRTVKNSRVRRK